MGYRKKNEKIDLDTWLKRIKNLKTLVDYVKDLKENQLELYEKDERQIMEVFKDIKGEFDSGPISEFIKKTKKKVEMMENMINSMRGTLDSVLKSKT